MNALVRGAAATAHAAVQYCALQSRAVYALVAQIKPSLTAFKDI
jgi:hypothetical protein